MLELEQAKQRVQELRTVIEKNNRLYYDQDAPELEDFEYDALTPRAERDWRLPIRSWSRPLLLRSMWVVHPAGALPR